MEQPKIQRLLRLLLMLSGKRIYTKSELEERMGLSERSIYRYVQTLESAGLLVERLPDGYRLKKHDPSTKTLQNLMHFSEEEVYMLQHIISGLEGSSTVHKQLLGKLHALYDLKVLGKLSDATYEKISLLGKAIRHKRQVMLHNYRSSNSSRISDRLVEPFEFTADYDGLWCFELQSERCKQFKLARMEHLELLDSLWGNENLHVLPFTDAFRMSAEKPIALVEAILSLKAYNLLIEEFPLAKKHTEPILNGRYRLKIPIADFHGIGRFVLGLSGEMELIGPMDFDTFLKNQQKKF